MARIRVWVLLGVTLGGLLVAGLPFYVINPFRVQTEQSLALALFLRTWGPWLALLLLAGGLWAAVSVWKGPRSVLRRGLAGLAVVLLLVSLLAARWNPVETMFRPLPNPQYVEAREAEHVEASAMVLGMRVGEEAKAYPVLQLAYHHLVNDTLGGVAFVATY